MGIRESLNENRSVSIGATIGIIVLAIGFLIWNLSGGKSDLPLGGGKMYFSDDDGKSFFAAEDANIPPFDRNGKSAVGAQVYQTDGGKTKFVAYLYRYSAEGKKKLEAARNSPAEMFNRMEYLEVKKPGTGDTAWVKSTSPQAIEIQTVRPPAGTTGEPEPAMP